MTHVCSSSRGVAPRGSNKGRAMTPALTERLAWGNRTVREYDGPIQPSPGERMHCPLPGRHWDPNRQHRQRDVPVRREHRSG